MGVPGKGRVNVDSIPGFLVTGNGPFKMGKKREKLACKRRFSSDFALAELHKSCRWGKWCNRGHYGVKKYWLELGIWKEPVWWPSVSASSLGKERAPGGRWDWQSGALRAERKQVDGNKPLGCNSVPSCQLCLSSPTHFMELALQATLAPTQPSLVAQQQRICLQCRDTGSIPGSGKSPGGGHGNPLQYSCLENPTDRGAWRATVLRVT